MTANATTRSLAKTWRINQTKSLSGGEMILISLNMGLSAVIFLNVQRELNVGAIFKRFAL